MRPSTPSLGAAACCAALLFAACGSDDAETTTVIANISQPRGLSADDSSICVAETGRISPDQTAQQERGQLEARTGRVVCADVANSDMNVALDDLPFVHYPDAAVTSGANDVIRTEGQLYALIGESYGVNSRSIVVDGLAEPRQVVDLLAYAEAVGGAQTATRSNPYSFVLAPDATGFYVSDAALGVVLWAGLDGAVDQFAPVPGHEVLTGLEWGPDGDLYVASFGQLPHPAGSGAVLAIDESGIHRDVVDGLTMPIDVGFDQSGGMLILEYATPPSAPQGVDAYQDGTGRLSYLAPASVDAQPIVLADELDRPTAFAVHGTDVYISLSVGEQAALEGSVVRFDLSQLLDGNQPAAATPSQFSDNEE